MLHLKEWLEEYLGKENPWYVKRLSGNDTLANKTHQAGPYIPREFLLQALPELDRKEVLNPDVLFDMHIDSHSDQRCVRAIWYNNKFHSRTRNETRLTNLGGQESALLEPDNTGALVVFVFSHDKASPRPKCNVWICRDETEENAVECRLGPVEPGIGFYLIPSSDFIPQVPTSNLYKKCWLNPNQIPSNWLQKFPPSKEIVMQSVELHSSRKHPPDSRLLRRRECEFILFRSVEEAIESPAIIQQKAFQSMDEFLKRAQSILQRRRTRSGLSLELHLRIILEEEGFREGHDFAYQAETEAGKRPDFLFPSAVSYADPTFPKERLQMLGVKNTCKDRWRQILNEADRIESKHLLTLQEGISERQIREMTKSGVQLIVPKPLHKKFEKAVRPLLWTLEDFISHVRHLSLKKP